MDVDELDKTIHYSTQTHFVKLYLFLFLVPCFDVRFSHKNDVLLPFVLLGVIVLLMLVVSIYDFHVRCGSTVTRKVSRVMLEQ